MLHNADLGTLTILSGAANSGNFDPLGIGSEGVRKVAAGSLADLIIYAPATLTNTCNIQVAPNESPAAGDWKDLYIAGNLVTVPAGGATSIPCAAFRAIRVHSAGNEGADRVFTLVGQLATI